MEGVLRALRSAPTSPADDVLEVVVVDPVEPDRSDSIADHQELVESVTLEPEADLPDEEPTPYGDLKELRNGLAYEAEVDVREGDHAASERKKKEAYRAKVSLTLHRPTAATTVEELELSNPKLTQVLPGLSGLLSTAEVSPFYETLYSNKIGRIRSKASEWTKLLSRHNFFDCDTILQLQAPESGQRMLLIQGDMDVVSDGSDGDRLAEMPDEIVNSTHYQPFTSYGWKKTTDKENPMIPGWRQRIKNADAELANPATTAERATWLRERKKMLKVGIEDMQRRSFLIAEYDPFIVLPVNFLVAKNTKFTGRVGDYAVVIHEGRALPAIVGDGGPTFKVGEGSLRLAKELNSTASSYSRPVSSLGVTYLVFCGSAGPKAAPDYDLWRSRCLELLDEVGGLGEGIELFEWEDTLPKPDPVVVVPTIEVETVDGEPVPDVDLEIIPIEPANNGERTDQQ